MSKNTFITIIVHAGLLGGIFMVLLAFTTTLAYPWVNNLVGLAGVILAIGCLVYILAKLNS